ncbi:sushi domain-containing protein 4-like [Eublepharis macularius]|uniref:Sushi domain-containing protein 4-like n=1 Tax=Eublepharis macularius TaxID=481883 RepID=A0AA97KIB3_EUBMA|nr:sushi domain-containing protein 4-like [Eublepharis macularius]XP_054855748.1 sushi domain-containing protein 4-like [Eublepharis macularius]
MRFLAVSLVLVALCQAQTLHKGKACGAPDMPLHSTCICQPPLCQGALDSGTFKEDTELKCYCHPGYGQAGLPGVSICRGGKWDVVQDVLCKPQETSTAPGGGNLTLLVSTSLTAAASVVLSALIFAVVLCVLVKPKPCSCSYRSQVYEVLEEPDLVVVEGMEEPGTTHREDTPEPLPSYEEAVCGHTGAPSPAGSQWQMPLVLSAQPELSDGSPVAGGPVEVVDPPPSYQEAMAAACTLPENAPGK